MKTLGQSIPLMVLSMAIASGSLADSKAEDLERGKYLVEIGGCNDCHTPGFAQNMGKVPEQSWLLGSDIGFSGPWGVSYASNLRLFAAAATEDQWLSRIAGGGLPPMPWLSLQVMNDADRKAVFHYLRSLGAAGEPAPSSLPPGQPIKTPHISFVPVSAEADR